MQLVWMVSDDDLLSAAATKVGLRVLASQIGVELPDDATVMLLNDPPIGSYPIARATGDDGSVLWAASYAAVARALIFAGSDELEAAGLDPQADRTFEADAIVLLRRRFPHWPPNLFHDLRGALPALFELALEHAGEDD